MRDWKIIFGCLLIQRYTIIILHYGGLIFLVNFRPASESSESLHSPVSPTAKMVSPSIDSLGFLGGVGEVFRGGAMLMVSAKEVVAWPEGETARSSSLRAAASSGSRSERPEEIERISKPPSSS